MSFKANSDQQNKESINSTNSHLISPNFTPEKLVFVSHPTTPRDANMTAPRLAYKAPKINKGCLVETIDKFHTGVAKLYSPPKWRGNESLTSASGQVLQSRVIRTNCGENKATKMDQIADDSPASTQQQRRGSGGAYCVECNQWRHKFDFTKSQWRNRPRGFRRCKVCTGEIGSDSKAAPTKNSKTWSPRRFRLKSK